MAPLLTAAQRVDLPMRIEGGELASKLVSMNVSAERVGQIFRDVPRSHPLGDAPRNLGGYEVRDFIEDAVPTRREAPGRCCRNCWRRSFPLSTTG
jgi:hypothetical protein